MKKFLEKFPLPISGLALGMAALGNLVRSYGEIYRSIFGVLSFIIIVLLTIKILMREFCNIFNGNNYFIVIY